MNAIPQHNFISPELLVELQDAANKLAKGERNSEAAKQAALRMDRMR
jgi:hypothetical protein